MQDLFDMKREELKDFLKHLIGNVNDKNELEQILDNNVYINEANKELNQRFCDKYEESMITFQGMLNGDKDSFFNSHFATVFKQAPTSTTYKLLLKKFNLLDQLENNYIQKRADFSFGSRYENFGSTILLILSTAFLIMSFIYNWIPLLKVLMMLLFISCIYLVYCTYKFKKYKTKTNEIIKEKDTVAAEMEKISLPYLQKMFEEALDEWENDPNNIEIMREAKENTEKIRKQLAMIDLDGLKLIPVKFRSLEFLQLFETFLQDGRADSWKECVNLYHQDVQFDENIRHHREQEEHNRQQTEIQQQELWEQRHQSDLQRQQLSESIRQSGIQQEQLNENIKQSTLQHQQLDEMANQSKMQRDQLHEARKQTANQDKQLDELQKHTKLGKIIGASSIFQNVQLNDIHKEQKSHDRWVEKGFRTKEEEEQYRRTHPKWSRNHPRQGYYR
ncbi:hypothetical protein G5T19_02240 [Lactobacillus reuteri]|nr:hypothetical protein [Limosilactobacillus reuteri]